MAARSSELLVVPRSNLGLCEAQEVFGKICFAHREVTLAVRVEQLQHVAVWVTHEDELTAERAHWDLC